jgi:hypothetical protein
MANHALVLVDGPPRCGKSTLARQLAASSSAGAILARAGSLEGSRLLATPRGLSAARPVILDGATMDEARILLRSLADQPLAGQTSGLSTESALGSADMPTGWRTAGPAAGPAATHPRLPCFVLVGGPFRLLAKSPCGSIPADPATASHSTSGSGAARTSISQPFAAPQGIARLTLSPLTLAEVGRGSVRTHWLRGGYPEAYTADNEEAARDVLQQLVADLGGGLLQPWGLPASPSRLATLLAHFAVNGGNPVNENHLARLMQTSRPTICRWIQGLVQAGLLRSLPFMQGIKGARRSVKGSTWLLRDPGLAHSLLNLSGSNDLRSQPRMAATTWQAYVVEQTISLIGPETQAGSYRSADSAHIGLVLTKADRRVAVVPSLYRLVSPGRAATQGAEAVAATDRYLVVPEGQARDIGGGFEAMGLADFLDELRSTFG